LGLAHNNLISLKNTRDQFSVRTGSFIREFFFIPAVEVHATQFLNLIRGDWLRRPRAGIEIAIITLGSFVWVWTVAFQALDATGMALVGCLRRHLDFRKVCSSCNASGLRG